MNDQITTASGSNKRLRRIVLFLSLGGALAVFAYVGYWFAVSRWLENRIADWEARERAKGNEIAHGPLKIGGFPFELTILTTDFRYGRMRGDVTESVATGHLRATARPWSPLDVTLVAETGLTATQRQAATGKVVTLSAGPGTQVETRFFFSGVLAHARLTAVGGTLSAEQEGDGLGPREAARFAGASATLDQAERITHETDASAVISVTATGVESPVLKSFGTRNAPAALALEATLRGIVEGTGPADLALWRDNGGTLDIDRFTIAMDPIGLKLNATLALDRQLRPEGAGTLEVKGFDQMLGDLVKAGHMKRDAAEVAKLVLGAFSRTSPADGSRIVSLPVAAQDGRVSAGPFTLFRLSGL